MRIFRVLPDLRILVTGVVRSLPPLFSMTLLVTVILFIYGMIGWLLFGEQLTEDWGTIGAAMLTLFVMLTLEDFPVYMDAGMEVHPWSWVYFVTFVLLAAFGARARAATAARDRPALRAGDRPGAGGRADPDAARGAPRARGRAQAARSRRIRPRIPLTSRPASSEA